MAGRFALQLLTMQTGVLALGAQASAMHQTYQGIRTIPPLVLGMIAFTPVAVNFAGLLGLLCMPCCACRLLPRCSACATFALLFWYSLFGGLFMTGHIVLSDVCREKAALMDFYTKVRWCTSTQRSRGGAEG